MLQLISREEWLAWRQQWRQEYKKLAVQIRALKVATRLASKGGFAASNRAMEAQQAVASTLQSMRAKESNYAHHMMNELDDMKEYCRLSVAFERFTRLDTLVKNIGT